MTERDNEIFESLVADLKDDRAFNKTARQFAGGQFARRMVVASTVAVLGLVVLFVSLSAAPEPFNIIGSLVGLVVLYAGLSYAPIFGKGKNLSKSSKGHPFPENQSAYMKRLEDRWEQRKSNG